MSAVEVHDAADALVAYARDTFWRDDSPFHRSSRHAYEAAAAWLHEHVDGVTDDTATHLFAPDDLDVSLSLCGEIGPTTTHKTDVTCGRCRIGATS